MSAGDFPEKLIQNLTLRARFRKHPRLTRKAKSSMKRDIRSAIRRIPAAQPVNTRARQDKVAVVLKKIATADDEDCTCKRLARSLKMDPNDLDVYLRHLMDRNFIRKSSTVNDDCWYTTTARGRTYLVKQALL
jgi:predicted transcriptional regulator